MFPNDNIIIKNEPIKNEETEQLLLQDIKCEETIYEMKHRNSSDFIDADDVIPSSSTKTFICTETEYLDDKSSAFVSIIVKEEPRLHIYDESLNTKPSNCNDNKVNAKRAGKKRLNHKQRKRTFECFVCKYITKNAVDLRRHLKVHATKEPLTGKDPEQKCVRKSILNRHKQNEHTSEKPFACDECDRKYSRESTLKLHKLLHTGESPYAC